MPHVRHVKSACACNAQDRSIGCVIWCIGGNLPAANFIRLPQLRGRSLGLTGRILYLQVAGAAAPALSHPRLDVRE